MKTNQATRIWLTLGLLVSAPSLLLPAQAQKQAQKAVQKFVGEDQVQWEDKWYPLDDGAEKMLMVRRGISEMGLWAQFRNDYAQKLRCEALITSRLASGNPYKSLCFPTLGPAETRVIPYIPGEEISKVEISKFQMGEVISEPKKAAPEPEKTPEKPVK